MNTKLTHNDQITLSAYLDGQLSVREQAQFKARLEQQPELHAAMEDMRRTRALLRLTPQRRAPRNYTLKPEWVPARRKLFQWVPALRLSSALASVMMVILALNNLLPLAGGALTPAASPEMLAANDSSNYSSAMEAAETAAQEEATPMIVIWGMPQAPAGLGGMGGGPAETPSGERELAPQEPTPAPEIITEDGQNKASGDPTPVVTEYAAIEGSGPILGVRPTEQAGQIQRDANNAAQPDSNEPALADESALGHGQASPNPYNSGNPWLIPGALLIVALFTGGMAYYLQNKKL